MKTFLLPVLLAVSVSLAHAQLSVTVSPPKIGGQKAVVPLAFKNGLPEKVQSARAVVFLLDEQGKMQAQVTRWVIGGDRDKAGLAPGATNSFHFVVASDKPFATTNLTAKVTFTRVILEGGKSVDPEKSVQIQR
jgi:hypothetical protein